MPLAVFYSNVSEALEFSVLFVFGLRFLPFPVTPIASKCRGEGDYALKWSRRTLSLCGLPFFFLISLLYIYILKLEVFNKCYPWFASILPFLFFLNEKVFSFCMPGQSWNENQKKGFGFSFEISSSLLLL